MEAERAKRNAMMKLEQTAKAMLENFSVEEKGWIHYCTTQAASSVEVAWRCWEGTQIRQWNELPAPPAAQPWTDEEDSNLERIRSATISLQDTILADKRKKIATSFSAQVQHLSPGIFEKLEQAMASAKARSTSPTNVDAHDA